MKHMRGSGYSAEEIEHFLAGFYTVLSQEELHVEVLEQLIEEVHSAASTKLWHTLKSVYGFGNFLNIIRNTYLMGKGELYQLLLDGIFAQTFVPVQDTRRANLTLDSQVLSSASHVLGLDAEEMTDIFCLRVNGYKRTLQLPVYTDSRYHGAKMAEWTTRAGLYWLELRQYYPHLMRLPPSVVLCAQLTRYNSTRDRSCKSLRSWCKASKQGAFP